MPLVILLAFRLLTNQSDRILNFQRRLMQKARLNRLISHKNGQRDYLFVQLVNPLSSLTRLDRVSDQGGDATRWLELLRNQTATEATVRQRLSAF
ncbi:hypothetical protein F5I97DRAFT_1175036 [Phlebopus sp. FC_14]|nr:hypothetical protein F5I97DRAFT_1175036 [Phlebopus sp. FC_14]